MKDMVMGREDSIMRSCSVSNTACYLTDVLKKNEMYGSCGTYGGEKSCKQSFDEDT
jgi:hypothetical protein